MRYMGGKSRIAKHLAAVIDEHREPGQLVWDAFCGGLSMSVALSKKGPVYSTDICAPLIALYKAVQNGWDPPTEVSKETWEAAKKLPDSDPMKAFCGFGCSFGGKWFAGYAQAKPIVEKGVARTKVNNYAGNSAKLLLQKLKSDFKVECLSFMHVTPGPEFPLIYCDIPYGGTTGFSGAGEFDRGLFIAHVVQWSEFSDIFVSEYEFPLGQVVWSKALDSRVNVKSGSAKKSVEKLYHIPKGSL